MKETTSFENEGKYFRPERFKNLERIYIKM